MHINKILMDLFLFKGLSEEEINALSDKMNYETRSYQKGELIYSPLSFEKKIGFILSGKCEVKRMKCDGTDVLLNSLSVNDSFGVLAAFSDSAEFPTSIYAKTKCDILFIGSSELYGICEISSKAALNVIDFMANRIAFLNKKVATYSSDSVKGKLAGFILGESEKISSDLFALNCKRCSEILNAGRASVYRAINSLVADGFIKYDNKKIYIIDREGLERTKK